MRNYDKGNMIMENSVYTEVDYSDISVQDAKNLLTGQRKGYIDLHDEDIIALIGLVDCAAADDEFGAELDKDYLVKAMEGLENETAYQLLSLVEITGMDLDVVADLIMQLVEEGVVIEFADGYGEDPSVFAVRSKFPELAAEMDEMATW